MRIFSTILVVFMILLASCSEKKQDSDQKSDKDVKMSIIDEATQKNVIDKLLDKYGEDEKFRIEKGVKQAAAFWMESDGSKEEFEKFCMDSFLTEDTGLNELFDRLNHNLEVIHGNLHEISMELRRPLDLATGEPLPIDYIFAGYSPSSNLTDDMYNNKIAFHVLLNFPFYSLDEKNELGKGWSRKQWAYARMGDIFTARVPGELLQEYSLVRTDADAYINEYNIFVGSLVDNEGQTFFPTGKKLITHWNLRDEIKSQYGQEGAIDRQKIIYEAMTRIISQEIPEIVINTEEFQWNPYKNEVYKDGKPVEFKSEPDTRYQKILTNYKALRAIDPYCPFYPTYIQRKFSEEMEMPQAEVEKMFTDFVSSPLAKQVGQLIEKRLGRKLEPFDIWYDGFKARSGINQDELSKKTRAKYPDPDAFAKDMNRMLRKLGFSQPKANFIASKIAVEGSRGPGHAAGAVMRSEKSHLRTRIGEDGMDYKGYNIAVHEFGHNVEQTITLYEMDYYSLSGVPNTAFTEAVAFIFQKRDLELLGIKNDDKNLNHLRALDNFWSTYEIMGVSLVDMRLWKWLYANENVTATQVKEQTMKIAKEVWNEYYAPVFGIKDQTILAIYSHMIDYPLYLSAYPIGHLIEFQEEQFMEGKNLAKELERMLVQGRLTPNIWMQGAVGSDVSIQPSLKATEEALKHIEQ